MEQENKIELVSEDVQQIISYRPHWVIRRGNWIFLSILCGLLGLTWLIPYPDTITASARLVAVNMPKMSLAKKAGRLARLYVRNEQQVEEGQLLACLQSTASEQEVLHLKRWLDTVMQLLLEDRFEMLLKKDFPAGNQYGELQEAVQESALLFLDARQVLDNGYYQQKQAALHRDLRFLALLKKNIGKQKSILQQEQQLEHTEYQAYEQLAKEKVIAPLELNQYKNRLLAKEQGMEQINSQLTGSDWSGHNKQKELLDLSRQVADRKQQLRAALLNLNSRVGQWMDQYFITAPEKGRVYFIRALSENEWLDAGQEVFYIQDRPAFFYAELMAAQPGLGKIRPGQKVRLKTESYPENEFGYLSGTISYITRLPNRRDSFRISMELDKGLTTNSGREIYFRNNLSGKAEIITANPRLADRLLGQLKQTWSR